MEEFVYEHLEIEVIQFGKDDVILASDGCRCEACPGEFGVDDDDPVVEGIGCMS